ncbi:Gfo/Idh/MocA family oxidoreductase [Paenibacillus sp. JCM 10914]|uniref:Gfo/Idh/MocA family protein n=1 Tax=Paenibacillus sp. JCM 10914 TaxID=1236974 RepID=UPI0003CC60DD|nr:Gfo/Idh/MocA family oxidoreductase [Paenibacillus sp. JCM 10914]GAE08529.1 NADH-dependent dyhydrogenase [Paenibacillus sp. JCM 10914]
MKFGVISFAHMHAVSYTKALLAIEGIELVGISDPMEERGRKYADWFGTTYYADYHDLLATELDGIIVTSENALHKEHVLAAAAAGVHVLCEKPLSTHIQNAQEMIDACRKQGVLLQTAFPVRYNASVIRAKQLIAEGKLGKVLAMKGTNRGRIPGGWFIEPSLSGGGAVIDHTVHVADIMRWITGAEIQEVYAEVDHMISDQLIDDCGMLTMEFDNGIFATLDCSWSRNKEFPTWGDVTLEIIGTAGTLSVNATSQKLHVYNDEVGYRHHAWGDSMDARLIRDFVASIRTGATEASVTGEDGLHALAVAIAAYRSSEAHKPIAIRDL